MRIHLAALLTGLTTSLLSAATPAAPKAPTNIVVIIADDLGYGDLGCYGAKSILTPNIDRIAAEGLRFTDAYAPASMCTPTRYSMLTGRYAFRHSPVAKGVLTGAAGLSIDPAETTLASQLRSAGYTTALVGKWHLGLGDGQNLDFNQAIKPGPRELGFDHAYYIPATVDRVPTVFVRDRHVENLDPADPISVSYGQKIGDEPTGKENPELVRHRPSHGHNNTIINGIPRIGFMTGGKTARWKDEDIADTLVREARAFITATHDKPFFLYFATHDPHVPRMPHPRFAGKSAHGTRGDVIQQFDWCVGEVIAALREKNLLENTLIILSSDNGGVMDDGYIDGSQKSDPDHSCNGPLRGYKTSLAEGGVRVPLIARWPGHVPVGESPEIVALVDLMATFSGLLNQPLPAKAAPDSFDFSGVLLGQPGAKGRTEIIVQGGGGDLGLRSGPWKLIPKDTTGPERRGFVKGKAPKGPELYDLSQDIGEKTNLAETHPETVTELKTLLEKLSK